jgi:hypothetical protein
MQCTHGIKLRISMAEAASYKKESLIHQEMDFNLRKKLVKCYI